MIYRGLYHFTRAHQKGKATDPVKYFADPQNRDLGIISFLDYFVIPSGQGESAKYSSTF
jgi:hypothetical protein